MTLILGIESSCDETASALLIDGKEIITEKISSQIDLHTLYGGVIPELASRRHHEVILPLIQATLKEAKVKLEELDAIAVTQGPGLIGALMMGLNVAKTLAMTLSIPLLGVDHVYAHLYAASFTKEPLFPALGLVLSGGHTHLFYLRSWLDIRLLSATVDDAIGEAFDKAARLLGLAYPGGPLLEKLARHGNPHAFPFKAGLVKKDPLAFSFSGLKTSLLYQIQKQSLNETIKADLAASFQRAAVDDILKKIQLAQELFPCKNLLMGGGVCHNQNLRQRLEKAQLSFPIIWSPPSLCSDNASMIAGLGYQLFMKEQIAAPDLDAYARSSFLRMERPES